MALLQNAKRHLTCIVPAFVQRQLQERNVDAMIKGLTVVQMLHGLLKSPCGKAHTSAAPQCSVPQDWPANAV